MKTAAVSACYKRCKTKNLLNPVKNLKCDNAFYESCAKLYSDIKIINKIKIDETLFINLPSRKQKKQKYNDKWGKVAKKTLNEKSPDITGTKKANRYNDSTQKSFFICIQVKTINKKLSAMVNSYFPEAEYEKLSSRYPKYYSSFKIMIDLTNNKAAKNPELWPSGTYVTRYFHHRPKILTTQ